MCSNIPNQLISISISIFLILPNAYGTSPVAKLGCPERCGNLSIPYPFGVGSDCSFHSSFDINCNTSFVPPKAYLSSLNKQVIEINKTYIRLKSPFLISACYNLLGFAESSQPSVTSVNLSATTYTLSERNSLFAIGCDDVLLDSNASSMSGGCSAFCAERNDTGGIGYCPFNATSQSNGCCQMSIIDDDPSFVGAQLIDLSRKLGRKRLFPCSYAFIQETPNVNETAFSYPLHYLENSTAMLTDDWASVARPPVVRLNWRIGAENCSQARKNVTTYACRYEKSVCVDDDDDSTADYFYFYYFRVEKTVRGYHCSCISGFEGNPYLPGGCQAISYASTIAKPGCVDRCGKLAIPFPFGIGQSCYQDLSFEIVCNTSTNPPKAYISILNKEVTDLNSSLVQVIYPNLGLACYDHHGITKTQEQSLMIDLSRTQYTLSNENWVTAIGCDDLVVGTIGRGNQSYIGTSCATVCLQKPTTIYYSTQCPSGSPMYILGDGCCKATIPRGTSYLKMNSTYLRGQWPRTNFSCSYFFISSKHPYAFEYYPIFNNSTEITNDLFSSTYWGLQKTLKLHWRIGVVNCKKAQENPANFVCQANSDCIDFDDVVKGYLCNCSKGYQGNPYLKSGCQDIDECADDTTNPCDSHAKCVNTPGSAYCLCNDGYDGEGRKDGKGCIPLSPSKTKMIIFTGMGSALGFLLFLLACLWFYKVLENRKKKFLKEKFFKRNGGLLLQQQTHEDTIGKTKVYSAYELEVATDNFNESRILGRGGQGIVYKGMLSNGKIVAIKKSKLVEDNQVKQFINEVVILSQINHKMW